LFECYLLIAAIFIFACLLLTKVSGKLGIPVLLAFLVLGMLCGSDGILKIHFDDYHFAELICSFALIFIMFYGGFGTNWKTAQPIIAKSVLLSSLGTVLTAAITGLFCYFVLHMEFWESMLMGSVIGSTDAASVFSILRSRKINLSGGSAPILEVESGSNDPFSYLLTITVLSVMTHEVSPGGIVFMLFSQLVFGGLVGVFTAFLFGKMLDWMHNDNDGFDTILVFAVAILSYAFASMIGGNGYLSTYIAGIILGNRPMHNKKPLVHFFDGITSLMQMLLFFLLGLLSYPSQLPAIAFSALAIALFLTLVARPAAITLLLKPFGCSINQIGLISWAGIRGAASIVFAIMATVHPAYFKMDIFHIVFFIVLFSISIQGSLIPWMAKRMKMIDNGADVMKTFSDYTEEYALQFVKLQLDEDHPWNGLAVRDLRMPTGLLLVLVLREKERIIPNGNTVLQEGDVVVLGAIAIEETMNRHLHEVQLETDHTWVGRSLAELKLGSHTQVVIIKRGDDVFIPNGKTVLQAEDILVYHYYHRY